MTNKENALEYIENLSEKELIDFFYEAVSKRSEYNDYKDGFSIETLCLVQSSFGEFENKIDEEHYSEFMALPSDELKNINWIKNEKIVTEQGKCPKCKALILCVAKEAICPICKTLVECT